MYDAPHFVALSLVFAFMAVRLVDVYFGGHYMCPRFGMRRAGRHSSDCPWSR
jgi:hypothetical protein